MNKILLLFCTFFIFSCRAQTNEDKIIKTTDKIIEALKSGNQEAFKKMIGVELIQIGKNEELLDEDFKKCKSFYDKYLMGRKNSVLITNEYTVLGERKVIMPLYKGYDSVANVSEIRLEFYFGPPNMVSLDKISNYKLIVNNIKSPVIIAPPSY